MRRIGKCIYVRKLAGRFKNRAGVFGRLAPGDELLLFNAENVHGAYDTDDQEGQLIRNVCRVLIEGFEHAAVGKCAERIQQAVDNWRRIQGRVTRPASIYLKDVKLTVTGEGKLLIVTKNKIGYELIGREDTIAEIEKLIAEEIEKQVKVEVKLLEEHEHFEDKFVEITKNINMEIEEEDF